MRIKEHRWAAKEAEAQAKLASSTKPSAGLKRKINAEHHACEEAGRTALEHAIRCGELLAEAREAVRNGNGKWMTWVEKNFSGSKSTEENYRKLASNKQYLTEPGNSQHVANLSIREALALLVPVRAEPGDDGSGSERSPAGAGTEVKKEPGWDGSGAKPGMGCQIQKVSPAVIYGVGKLPVPESELAAVLGENRALVLRIDAPMGAERALSAALSHVEASVRAAWSIGCDTRLLVVGGTNSESMSGALGAIENVLTEEKADKEASEEQIEEYERRVIREVEKERDARSLYQIVKERGGIKPPADGYLREEYLQIPSCYKNNNGIPGDEMADYLATHHLEFGIFSESDLTDFFAHRSRGRAA